jgi:hypothetical protein
VQKGGLCFEVAYAPEFFFKNGTFDTSPPPFDDGKIVFIHLKLPDSRVMPAAFATLSRKVFVLMFWRVEGKWGCSMNIRRKYSKPSHRAANRS